MELIRLDIRNIKPLCREECLQRFQEQMTDVHRMLVSRQGKGSDFLGWLDLPETPESLIQQMEEEAARIQSMADIMVVIGIGGSYLGARAVIEAMVNPFQSMVSAKGTTIVYAGHNLSTDYHAALLDMLDRKDYAVAVISKSGTTTEPAIAFRLIRSHLERKYGRDGARPRIIAITDVVKGALKQMAGREGYQTYIIPDDVGGRYSVLTPVGLLPIAVAGIDIRKLLEGAGSISKVAQASGVFEENPCAFYAGIRNILYRNGKCIELLVTYEPGLAYFAEWWKQLFGESEGKEGKGIFPAGVTFTTDLHSMGQYIQEGMRTLFQTVISIEKPQQKIIIPSGKENLDGLNYLGGKELSEVSQKAEQGTIMAHVEGQVPVVRIQVPEINPYYLGQLIYFFEFSCALSGYALGVNPFDQPGVEAYKRNMFALLGKPV